MISTSPQHRPRQEIALNARPWRFAEGTLFQPIDVEPPLRKQPRAVELYERVQVTAWGTCSLKKSMNARTEGSSPRRDGSNMLTLAMPACH